MAVEEAEELGLDVLVAEADAVAVGVALGVGRLGFRACAERYRHPGGAVRTGV